MSVEVCDEDGCFANGHARCAASRLRFGELQMTKYYWSETGSTFCSLLTIPAGQALFQAILQRLSDIG